MKLERHVRLFRNGRNQAVRIPREFEIEGDEAIIRKEENRLILEPIQKKTSLTQWLAGLSPIDAEFPEIEDPPAEPEKII